MIEAFDLGVADGDAVLGALAMLEETLELDEEAAAGVPARADTEVTAAVPASSSASVREPVAAAEPTAPSLATAALPLPTPLTGSA